MRLFHLPVVAIVVICFSLTALAIMVKDGEPGIDPPSLSQIRLMAYSTQTDRLVERYMKSDQPSYKKLVDESISYLGDEAFSSLLDAVDTAMRSYSDDELDKLYHLRGMVLRDTGHGKAAMESFRKALTLNPDNDGARTATINYHKKDNAVERISSKAKEGFSVEVSALSYTPDTSEGL